MNNTIQSTTGEQLDGNVVALAKAIRSVESQDNYNAHGKSGEFGAYQFMPDTWKISAQRYLGDQNAPMTPVNQDKVAYYAIKGYKDQGYSPEEIASLWNSGKPNWVGNVGTNQFGVKFDTPKYVNEVSQKFKEIGQQMFQQPQTTTSSNVSSQEITGNESPVQAGINALINTPGSALKFAGSVLQSMNPISILGTISQIPGAFDELVKAKGGVLPALESAISELPGQTMNALIPEGVQKAATGDFQGASKAFQQDPFGQAAPLVLAAEGGAKAIDRVTGIDLTGAVDKGISKVGGKVVDTVGDVVKPVTNIAGALPRSIVSHFTGLDPQTISTIISDPAAFKRIAQDNISRGGLAEEFANSIDTRLTNLEETGKGYEPIRKLETPVAVPENFIQSVLDKFGLKLEAVEETLKKGELPTIDATGDIPSKYKVVANSDSVTRNPSDLKAIQQFVDNWGAKGNLTPNEFLNMRSDLAELAKYDKMTGMGKTAKSQVVADALRQEANKTMRPQIKGLKEIDEVYAKEKPILDQIRKDFLTKDASTGEWRLKDNAASKIANAGNKVELLKRMENILPGVTKRIQILNAVEDIERAKGIKVGAYTRGALEGFGALTGNIPAVVAAIISHPTIAVQIIKGFGLSKAAVVPVLNALKLYAGDINHLKLPIVNQNKETISSIGSKLNIDQSLPLQK